MNPEKAREPFRNYWLGLLCIVAGTLAFAFSCLWLVVLHSENPGTLWFWVLFLAFGLAYHFVEPTGLSSKSRSLLGTAISLTFLIALATLVKDLRAVAAVVIFWFPAAYLAWLGKGLSARNADRLLSKDNQAVLLYLRSFGDDHGSGEFQLAESLAWAGSLVAIGRPGEWIQTVGAARLYVNDNNWQDHVRDLIQRAQVIFLRIGATEGLVWEIEQALQATPIQKIVIFLDPPARSKFARRKAYESDYQDFCARATRILKHRFPGIEFPEEAGSARFVCFQADGTPILLSPRALTLWERFRDFLRDRNDHFLRKVVGIAFEAQGLPTPRLRVSFIEWMKMLCLLIVLGTGLLKLLI